MLELQLFLELSRKSTTPPHCLEIYYTGHASWQHQVIHCFWQRETEKLNGDNLHISFRRNAGLRIIPDEVVAIKDGLRGCRNFFQSIAISIDISKGEFNDNNNRIVQPRPNNVQ